LVDKIGRVQGACFLLLASSLKQVKVQSADGTRKSWLLDGVNKEARTATRERRKTSKPERSARKNIHDPPPNPYLDILETFEHSTDHPGVLSERGRLDALQR